MNSRDKGNAGKLHATVLGFCSLQSLGEFWEGVWLGFGGLLFKQICIGYESMIVQILTHSALFCGSVHSVENDRIFSVIIKEIP